MIWDSFFGWLENSINNALADFFTMITDFGTLLFELPWVHAMIRFFHLFGWGLFVCGFVVAIFEIAIEYQSAGRIVVKRQILPLIHSLLAVNLFTVVPIELYKFSVSLQNTFAHDLAGLDINMSQQASIAMNLINTLGRGDMLNLVFLIALGYCIIKVFFSNLKRGGILLIQIAVGSLHLFSLPRGYSDGFVAWCKQIIAICFTTFMQTTLLYMGLITIKTSVLLGLGVMLSSTEVPRIAGNFGLDTSTRVNMVGAMHGARTAVNLTRSLIKK